MRWKTTDLSLCNIYTCIAQGAPVKTFFIKETGIRATYSVCEIMIRSDKPILDLIIDLYNINIHLKTVIKIVQSWKSAMLHVRRITVVHFNLCAVETRVVV